MPKWFDGRHPRGELGVEPADQEHEASGMLVRQLGRQQRLGELLRRRRREGAEGLAELDLLVDALLHLGPPRVGEDRAVARARAGRTRSGPGTSRRPRRRRARRPSPSSTAPSSGSSRYSTPSACLERGGDLAPTSSASPSRRAGAARARSARATDVLDEERGAERARRSRRAPGGTKSCLDRASPRGCAGSRSRSAPRRPRSRGSSSRCARARRGARLTIARSVTSWTLAAMSA